VTTQTSRTSALGINFSDKIRVTSRTQTSRTSVTSRTPCNGEWLTEMENVDVSAPELEMFKLVEAEGIFGVLAALVDYVREECAMPTSWREHL
jgi:hypothetical protein